MCRFVYVLLFIFAPGNTLNLRQDCGGKILGERSGSIRYSLHPNSLLSNRITNESTEKLLDVTCTWIIDANKNKTVWIDVISVGKGAIGIQFGNGVTLIYEKEERALFSGTGRTIIEWSLRRTDQPFATLHLKWNTSEDSHNLALIPYADLVSPSPSGSNDVTYTPDIPVSSNAAPKTHTLRGENTWQGGGVSDLSDKHRPLFPQEITNNGQETAGAWISDLTFTGTHSYFDTHTNSALDTHVSTLIGSSHEPTLASTETQSPLLSVQTTTRQATDVATKTSALLATTDVAHTEFHRGSSQQSHTHAFIQSKIAKRGHPSSMFPIYSFISASPRNIQPFDKTSKNKDFLSDTVNKAKATTVMVPNKDVFTISENVGMSQFHAATIDDDQPIASEMDRTDRSPRSTNQNQTIYDDSVLTRSTPATVSKFPNVNQTNPLAFSDSDTIEYSGYSTSPSGISEPPINLTTENEPTTSSKFMHTSRNTLATPTLTSSEASTTRISHTIHSQHNTSTQETSSTSASMSDPTAHNHNEISAFTTFPTTIPPNLTPTESLSTPEEDEGLSQSGSDCLSLACTSYLPSTVRGEQENPITSPPSISLSSSASPRISPNVTSDLMVEDSTTVRFENRTDVEEPEVSPSQVQNTNTKSSMHTEFPNYTFTPQFSTPSSESTHSNVGFSDATDVNEMNSGQTAGRSHLSPTQISATSSKTTLGLSSFNDIHTGSTENTNGFIAHTTITLSTSSSDITAPYISQVSTTDPAFQTSTPVSTTTTHWETSQTSAVHTPSITTQQMNPHATSTETTSVRVHTHIPVPQPSTVRPPQQMTTSSNLIQTKARTISTQAITQTSRIHSTASSFDRKWPHGRHYFIVEDQPTTIKEKTFQVLLQIILEGDYAPSMRLLEVETFLQRLSGFQNQHVTWHSGQVLQTVVQFQTVEALSWLGRVESILQEAGLNPLPKKGIFVGGVRVKNITVGGLQTDVCEWLFECPSGFQCVSSKVNATCTSVCHTEYCNHQGICVHRLGQQPICQCPVGEDYWFMGQRCDLRMTRPRLVGMCFGVLVAVAAVMALLSYLAVWRFKSKLMQAKVEQTRSSYRRFNHFDELSARFWGRSWPGSEDSLDNPAFTRSDELLHLRALDRTCCYHDDTLSVVSTYHGSGTHLNTIYPHGSQYGWDLSNCSLADGVVDSGKASDLSVCSWPIEPIQWTPFPLLQQLNRNTTTVKASRPRSYCEGMELVDLEKSWTA